MNKAIEIIKEFEGCSLSAYKCPSGVWTIGYGHTGKDVKPGMIITAEESEKLLKADVEKFWKGVKKLTSGVELNENQLSALTSFSFNFGLGSLKTSTLLKTIKENPSALQKIEVEFMKWVFVGGKVMNGLIRRRRKEFELYKEVV